MSCRTGNSWLLFITLLECKSSVGFRAQSSVFTIKTYIRFIAMFITDLWHPMAIRAVMIFSERAISFDCHEIEFGWWARAMTLGCPRNNPSPRTDYIHGFIIILTRHIFWRTAVWCTSPLKFNFLANTLGGIMGKTFVSTNITYNHLYVRTNRTLWTTDVGRQI